MGNGSSKPPRSLELTHNGPGFREYTTLSDMWDKIYHCCTASTFNGNEVLYAEEGLLDEIVTGDFIREAFRISGGQVLEREDSLVRFVVEKSKKIFAAWLATLVTGSGWNFRDCMQKFQDHSIEDVNLPLEKSHEIFSALGWQANDWWPRLFCEERQWMFLVPVISTRSAAKYRYRLPKRTILPLIKVNDIPKDGYKDKGSFGKVLKYKVNTKHFKDEEDLVSPFVAYPRVQAWTNRS